MAEIKVHPRVHRRHPEIDDEDVRSAWRNAIAMGRRLDTVPHVLVAIGFDTNGRLLEILAVFMDEGTCLAFHAMKAAKKTFRELGLEERWPR